MPVQVLDAGEQDRLAVNCRCCGVEHGVDRIRPVGRGQDRVGRMAIEELAARSRRGRLARGRGDGDADAGRVEQQRGAMEGERRLGSFVVVGVSLAEPVAASAGREVVQRPVEMVAAEEPVERALRASAVLASPVTANAASSASTNADASSGCSSPAPGAGSLALAAEMAGQAKHAVARPDSSPSQRSDSRPVGNVVAVRAPFRRRSAPAEVARCRRRARPRTRANPRTPSLVCV